MVERADKPERIHDEPNQREIASAPKLKWAYWRARKYSVKCVHSGPPFCFSTRERSIFLQLLHYVDQCRAVSVVPICPFWRILVQVLLIGKTIRRIVIKPFPDAICAFLKLVDHLLAMMDKLRHNAASM